MLQIYLIIFTVLISIIGWFGYSQIREVAEKKAAKIAQDYIESFLQKANGLDMGKGDYDK